MKESARVLLTSFSILLSAGQPATVTASSEPAHQEAEAAAPPPAQRADVVVTATRTERTEADVPVSVTVIRRTDLESSPSLTTDGLLRGVPGVNLPLGSSLTIFPTNDTVSMRGLGGNRALVLVDGVPMNDPFQGYIPWNAVPLESVDRVEVVRGGAASLFGNYAMGGTLNLVTRPLTESRLDAEVSYGSLDTRRASVSASGVAGRLAGRLDVAALQTDGYVRPVPEQRGKIDIESYARLASALGKVELRGDDGWRGGLRVGYFWSDLSQGTPLANVNPEQLELVLSGHRDAPRSGATLDANLFYRRESLDIDSTLLVPGAGRDAEYRSNHRDVPSSQFGGSLQWSRPFRSVSLTAGLDVNRIRAEDRNQSFNRQGSPTTLRTSGGDQLFGGLFAQASVYPSARLEVLASARLDLYRNGDGRDGISGGDPTLYPARTSTEVDPRIALRFQLLDGLALRAAAYRAFRAPTLGELYRTTVTLTSQIVGNAELGPETLVGADVGADASLGSFSGEVNVFWNRVEDVITRVTLSLQPVQVLTAQNLGASRSAGLELMGRYTLARRLELELGYTFTDAVIEDNPSNRAFEGNSVPDVSRHAGHLGLTYRAPGRFRATVRARRLSTRYGDAANLLPMDAHTVLDAAASCPVGRLLEVFVKGENVLDEEYVSEVTVGRRLGSPRVVMAGLRLRLPL